MDKDSVVITGVGAISPNGIGRENFYNAIINGKNGISEIDSFDTSDYPTHKGGEVKNFNPEKYIKKMSACKLGRASQLAVSATYMALEDSSLDYQKINPKRIGVVMGTTLGEMEEMEKMTRIKHKEGIDAVPANFFGRYPCHLIPNNISMEFNFKGPSVMIPTACAAGNYAIGYAADLLKARKVDVMIAGGADPMSQLAFTGFNRLLTVAKNKCSPFSRNREGMMVSEGAGILILERYEDACKRGADIYARFQGYGIGCDAFDMTTPSPDGEGGVRTIEMAVKRSGISLKDIGYINAHGTGTKANDKIETIIIKKVFKDDAYRIPVSSIKSMLGHTMGAASALEAITCALVLKNGIIPPTINYEEPDEECDLDYVPNKAREITGLKYVLSNAFAFGGNNCSIILAKI
ncbi:MAG: beta-ketoacyl-[acyl-carrier-protein] synthase family protein [Spirochaetales bacterium]|nr:beta-ketoacyl-[acyl-carrier-protein] synthase family protein [Spirochaetales bacterium]